jgi:hypothetical protein
MSHMNDVHYDFSDLDADFERMRAEAEGRVARWVWAPLGAYWHVPIPHYAELSGFGPGSSSPLKREPAHWQLARHYALDGDDRVVVSRSYREKDVVAYEEFLQHADDVVESVTFDHEPWYPDTPPKAIVATRTVLEHGRAVERTTVNRDGDRQVYAPTWSGDVVTAVTHTSLRAGDAAPSADTYTFHYDDEGELLVIRSTANDTVLYRRPPKRLKPVLDLIERGLVSAIVRAVAEHRPDDPIGAIGIGFDGATLLHPTIGIQTERDLADEAKDAFDRWNPADMTVGLVPFDLDPEVDEAIAGINQHIEDTDDTKLFRSFQRRLAKTLNQRDWRAELTPAPDFAVDAVDLDDDDLLTSVRATLPKPVRQALAARGLV